MTFEISKTMRMQYRTCYYVSFISPWFVACCSNRRNVQFHLEVNENKDVKFVPIWIHGLLEFYLWTFIATDLILRISVKNQINLEALKLVVREKYVCSPKTSNMDLMKHY